MLSSGVRNQRLPLLGIAGLTLGLRYVEALVLAAPGTDVDVPILLLSFPAAVLAVGGIWVLGFLVLLRKVQSSVWDTEPLPDAFDPAGTPVLRRPAVS